MDLFSSTWLIIVIAFALGAGVGAAVFNLVRSDDSKSRKLEDELEQLQHDHEIYKQTVTNHFSKTSELVNNLTENYVEVYKHLAEGSQTLADGQQTHQQLGQQQANSLLSFVNEAEQKEEPKSPGFEPPKDYAPPAGENENGTLSESFSAGKESTKKDQG